MGIQFPTEHHLHQFDLRQFAGFATADKAAVTQNGDPIADLIDLIEKMGNEDQADAAIAQMPHQTEQHLDFLGIQAGGGFVEDQYFRRQIDSPANGDNLLHRHRKTV
ncbi:hypothetical protein D3C73_1160150 [compost metagenome]